VSDLLTAGTAVVGWQVRASQAKNADVRDRRRRAADALMTSLTDLRNLCRLGERASASQWVAGIVDVFEAVDEATFATPSGWSHLKRSSRAAIGEATCLAFADRYQCGGAHRFKVEPTWVGFAEEYFDHVIRAVGTWREHHSNRRARKVRLLDYDTWLRVTRRYETGVGLWPDEVRGRR
jgi:hypothetical protein